MGKVLIVDDEKRVRFAFSESLKEGGFSTIEASDGREALKIFMKEKPDTVLLDYKMPGMDGIETLQELKKTDPDIPIIMITAHGDIPVAVEAVKLGAYDFITKPPDFEKLIITIKRAVEKRELENRIKNLNEAVDNSLELMLGKSPNMKPVIRQIYQVASSDFSVVIQGETGTGKSFVARAIHNLSKRVNEPFISIDMGSIPETLVESELFGYEKGAFTGAGKKKKGFFEIANGGTILIDELQNMTPYVQGKLLRAVEEKKIFPLGSTEPIEIDVRILGATNADIRQAVKEQKFREDLFYRLSEFMIKMPPLRERIEDIPYLAMKFYRETCEELNKQAVGISDEAMAFLKDNLWRGNVRELKNVIKRAVLLSGTGELLKPENLEVLSKDSLKNDLQSFLQPVGGIPLLSLKDAEKMVIQQVMQLAKGKKTKAASMLEIDYKTLQKKLKEYNLQ